MPNDVFPHRRGTNTHIYAYAKPYTPASRIPVCLRCAAVFPALHGIQQPRTMQVRSRRIYPAAPGSACRAGRAHGRTVPWPSHRRLYQTLLSIFVPVFSFPSPAAIDINFGFLFFRDPACNFSQMAFRAKLRLQAFRLVWRQRK